MDGLMDKPNALRLSWTEWIRVAEDRSAHCPHTATANHKGKEFAFNVSPKRVKLHSYFSRFANYRVTQSP